jgi:glutathione peroxidase
MANELSALALTRLDGSSDSLAQHAGKVLLVVNVASQCGLTPQYEGLEALHELPRAGLRGAGVPGQ